MDQWYFSALTNQEELVAYLSNYWPSGSVICHQTLDLESYKIVISKLKAVFRYHDPQLQ